MRQELHADIRVADTHDWIARDGAVWVYCFVTVQVGNLRQRIPVLVREGDRP